MSRGVIGLLIGIAVLLGAGLIGWYFAIEAPSQARTEKLLRQEEAVRRLYQALLQEAPPQEPLQQLEKVLPESRSLTPLIQRLEAQIETEADRLQMVSELERLSAQIATALQHETEQRTRLSNLWLAGLALAILLFSFGSLWRLQREKSLLEHKLRDTQLTLQAWSQGHFDRPVPPQALERPALQAIQTAWEGIEAFLQGLETGDPEIPLPEGDHPLLRRLKALKSTLARRWGRRSEEALTLQSLAAFSEILKESQTIADLAERTVSLLCRQVGAHMGAIFVREGEVLALRGTYAYDLSQAAERRFHPGEGFVGQAAAEKRLLRIRPVPPNYLRLRSGLGEAAPHTLLLVPLVFQDEAYGVVELATLEPFPEELEPFLQKFAEHIGAALANFISREQLKALLTEEQTLRKTLEEKQAELLRSAQLMEEAQEKLIESQTQLASQIHAIRSAALVVELSAEGHIAYANEAFLTSTGYTLAQLEGASFADLVAAPELKQTLVAALETQEGWKGSLPLRTQKGETLWLQATLAPLQGRTKGYIGICFDITREKQQEEELRRMLEQTLAQEELLREANQRLQAFSEELLRTQTELKGQIAAVGNAAIVSETDLQGRIIRVNELFLQMYGYRPEEILGQNHRILKSGHQSDTVFEEMWRTISQGRVWRGEVRNRAKDGQYYWILLTITPVTSPEGKVLKYIGVGFDITAQKRQEEELRSALRLAQTQQEELRRYTQQLQTAQEEMRRTQVELRGQISAVHNAAIVAETDPEGRITFVNDAFCAISGYTREELLGNTHAILRSERHDDAFYRELWKTLSEKRVWKGIFCNRRRDGSLYWVSSTITPVVDTRGRLVKFIAVSFDLTPQVEQEKRLRAYAEELRRAQAELRGQILAVGNAAFLMETDTEGHLLYANSAALEAWGYTWDEVEGQNLRFLNSGHHPPEFWASMWETLQRGEVWQNEVLNRTRSGELFWQLLTITPIRDPEGRLFKYIGVAFDITAQKRQAERIRILLQEAQEKERSLRAYAEELEKAQAELLQAQLELAGRINALNNAAIVSETDPEGRILFVNDEATYVWGYSREELIGQLHNIIRSEAHPPRFFERMWDRIKSGFVWQGEVQNRAKDGTPFWVHLTITPVLDAEGRPYKYIGVAFDITRQKIQAQRLKEALRQLETQTQELPTYLQRLPWFLTDRQGTILSASPAWLELTGYDKPELVLGQNVRLLRSPQTPDYLFMDLWATIGRGKPWMGFLTNRDAHGVDRLQFLAIFPVEDRYLAVLLPAQEACEALKAEWMKNYAPLETLQEYQLLLQAKEYELEELERILHQLQSRPQ